MIGGRTALRVCPDVLSRLAAGRTSVVVTGTNGKTTTSHLIAAGLTGRGPLAHNASGSNMIDGAVAALMAAPRASLCVLEVDELHLGPVLDAVRPDVVVVLNLSRDQLDRASEVSSTARAVAEALAGRRGMVVVANVDDPMVVWAVGGAPARVVWTATEGRWQADTQVCPRCGHHLSRGPGGANPVSWSCRCCGLRRPDPHWWWEDAGPGPGAPAAGNGGFLVHRHGDAPVAVVAGLPGRVNKGNATMALAAVYALGSDPRLAAPHLAAVRSVAGRYRRLEHGRHTVQLLLVKNPAGWSEALDVLAAERPVLIIVNAREADGRDVSWLWDLPVDILVGREVAVAGEHAADLGVRLSYAGIPHHIHRDPLVALEALQAGEVDAVANYTAFRDFHQALAGADETTRRPACRLPTRAVPAPARTISAPKLRGTGAR